MFLLKLVSILTAVRLTLGWSGVIFMGNNILFLCLDYKNEIMSYAYIDLC